jgi:hypothetical protein
MYHLAKILLLISNPCRGTDILSVYNAIERELLHHSLQICGIAESKPSPGARAHAVQAIYYGKLRNCPPSMPIYFFVYSEDVSLTSWCLVAGCCFRDDAERARTAKLLGDIEDDLGWAAKYRVRDLYRQWGWTEPSTFQENADVDMP